jgi:hypothetical protein
VQETGIRFLRYGPLVTFFDHNRAPFKEVKLDYGHDKKVEGPQKTVMVNPRVRS